MAVSRPLSVAAALLGLAAPLLLVPPTAAAATAPSAQAPPSEAAGAAPAPQVRMRWQDFLAGAEGEKRLASLLAGVAKMRSLDDSPADSADYRRSWQYWANVHGYYGAESPFGPLQEQLDFLVENHYGCHLGSYRGIRDQTPPDEVAAKVWATCQHSGPEAAENFFGWHRIYLYYFERVLRWAADDETLRLPYWDYTDPAQVTLPEPYRQAGSPLFERRRDVGVNAAASSLDPDSTDVDEALAIDDFFSFQGKIEREIHGTVHCTVGPDCPIAQMGDVPLSANDPVFYAHHANIDRLWACWQGLHGDPDGEWRQQEFSFVDETGALVTRRVEDFLDAAALGYVYDRETGCGRGDQAAEEAVPAAEEEAAPAVAAAVPGVDEALPVLASAAGVAVDAPEIDIVLSPAAALYAASLEEVGRPGTLWLVLRDVVADAPPGALIHVLVARGDRPETRLHAGTLSWFGVFGHRGHGGAHPRTFQLDISDELAELGGRDAAGGGLVVSLVATDGRRHLDPEHAEAERDEAREAFRSEANLRIGAVELLAAPLDDE